MEIGILLLILIFSAILVFYMNQVGEYNSEEGYVSGNKLLCVPDSSYIEGTLSTGVPSYNKLSDALKTSKFDSATLAKATAAVDHFSLLKNMFINSSNQYIGPPNCSRYCNNATFSVSNNTTSDNPSCTCLYNNPGSIPVETPDSSIPIIGSKVVCQKQDCNTVPNSSYNPSTGYCTCNLYYDPIKMTTTPSTDPNLLSACVLPTIYTYTGVMDITVYNQMIYAFFNSNSMYIGLGNYLYGVDLSKVDLTQGAVTRLGLGVTVGIGDVGPLAYSPNSSYIVQAINSSSSWFSLFTFNGNTATKVSDLIMGTSYISSMAFTSDSNYLVVAVRPPYINGYLQIYSIVNNKLVQVGSNVTFTQVYNCLASSFATCIDPLCYVAVNPVYNSGHIIAALTYNSVILYSFNGSSTPVQLGPVVRTTASVGSNYLVNAVWSTNGLYLLISKLSDNTILVYTYNSSGPNYLTLVNTINTNAANLTTAAITQDGKYIFSMHYTGIKYYSFSNNSVVDKGFAYSIPVNQSVIIMIYNPYTKCFVCQYSPNGTNIYLKVIRFNL